MTKARATAGTRERLLDAAYSLFAERGVSQVGIEEILRKAGCAKASLYSNFESKTELAIAFLDRRAEVWLRDWLEAEIKNRAQHPREQLLAAFDVCDEWFRRRNFEGCSFIRVMLESAPGSPVHSAAVAYLGSIRTFIGTLAKGANLREPERFALVWQMILQGAVISACEGNADAARQAKSAAQMVLDGWPRR